MTTLLMNEHIKDYSRLVKLEFGQKKIIIVITVYGNELVILVSIYIFLGLGMYSWERSCLESVNFVHNIWNVVSGKALTRTFLISGFIVALDLLLKAIFLFGFGVPLFIDNNENGKTFKWGLWIIHKLLLTGVYGMVFLMYNSRWREKLPGKLIRRFYLPIIASTARPAFYNYIIIMFALYSLYLVASAFTANNAHFGFCLYLPFNSKYLQVIWDHECLLPRIIPSSSLHNVPRRLFPGRRFELGECILLRDEGCWIFRL
ncbi:contains weak to the SAPB protein (TR:E236624) [Arabidopsis thaliana]|nr:contains weak to the SAPB protein (TR:E236624) [Arabidopsis thaliana]